MQSTSPSYESPLITELGSVHDLTQTNSCWKVTKVSKTRDWHGKGCKKFTYTCSVQPH